MIEAIEIKQGKTKAKICARELPVIWADTIQTA